MKEKLKHHLCQLGKLLAQIAGDLAKFLALVCTYIIAIVTGLAIKLLLYALAILCVWYVLHWTGCVPSPELLKKFVF